MKTALGMLVCLLSIAATCALYGWLESTLNLIEGLGTLFEPGATTVVFTPFLLLFIALDLAVFVTVPMLLSAIVAALGSLLLRLRGVLVPASFIRSLIIASFVSHVAVVTFAAETDAAFLLRRPRVRPRTPAYAMACIAAGCGALNALAAGLIIRGLTSPSR